MAVTWVGLSTMVAGTGAINVQTHSGTQIGDVGLLMVTSANQTIATPTGDSGTWVPLGDQQGTGTAGSAGGVRLALFTMTFTKAYGSGNVPCTIADTGNFQCGRIVVMRNFLGIEATAGSVVTPANGTITWPAVTTTMAGSTIVNICATDEDYNGDMTSKLGTPTNANLTDAYEWATMSTSQGSGGGLLWIDWSQTNAGNTGQSTITHTTSQVFACITLAVNEHAQTLKSLAPVVHVAETFTQAVGKKLTEVAHAITSFIANLQSSAQQFVKALSVVVKGISTPRKSAVKPRANRMTNTPSVKRGNNQTLAQTIHSTLSLTKDNVQILKQTALAKLSLTKTNTKRLAQVVHATLSLTKGNAQWLTQKVKQTPIWAKLVTHGAIGVKIKTMTKLARTSGVFRKVRVTMIPLTRRVNSQILALRLTGHMAMQRMVAVARKVVVDGLATKIVRIARTFSNSVKGLTTFTAGLNEVFYQFTKELLSRVRGPSAFMRSVNKYARPRMTMAESVRKLNAQALNVRTTLHPVLKKAVGKVEKAIIDSWEHLTKSTGLIFNSMVHLSEAINRRSLHMTRIILTGLTGSQRRTSHFIAHKIAGFTQARRNIGKKVANAVKMTPSVIKSMISGLIQYTKNLSTRMVAHPLGILRQTQVVRKVKTAITTSRRISTANYRHVRLSINNVIKKASTVIFQAKTSIYELPSKLTARLVQVKAKAVAAFKWSWGLPDVLWVKIQGVWRMIQAEYTKINGIWKDARSDKKNDGKW